MHPLPGFRYVVARTVEEAVALKSGEPEARFLAGGTDLLPQMRLGRRKPTLLIDVKGIAELTRIEHLPDGGVSIGACAAMADVIADPVVAGSYPALAACLVEVGAWPLRNRATVGGNLCNASPAADSTPALLALDAEVRVQGPAGTRTIAVADLLVGPGRTSMAADELLVAVILPGRTAGWTAAYERMSRRRGMDLATLAVLVARGPATSGPAWRVALAAVAPTCLRVPEAEAILAADGVAGAAKAAAAARAASRPISDIRATADYRAEMVEVLTERAAGRLANGEGR